MINSLQKVFGIRSLSYSSSLLKYNSRFRYRNIFRFPNSNKITKASKNHSPILYKMPVKTTESTQDTISATDIDSQINYNDAIQYWSGVEATVDGVLGGFGESTSVPKADIVGSNTFLRKLKPRFSNEPDKIKYGIDFGAGIGRVTRDFLHKVCDKVDLLEPVPSFVQQMKVELKPLMEQGKIGEIYDISMQDWEPSEEGKYYLIWCQWCVGHVPDDVFITLLNNCKKGLQKDGLLVIKENNTNSDEDVFDEVDSSKTRSDKNFRRLFKLAGWDLIATDLQKGVPRELFPIRMYALKPSKN
ncbi:hypothetical protein B5S28_g2184 [[Candida] boidinii]|nr:hypothetical protein B5S28_g2184 [[Candida] boidinii]OWB63058.1 hypothetical protein B5S29_g4012 [[Candida] boidinii]